MKICSKCKRELDLSHFRKNTRSKDGYNYQCIDCERELAKSQREANKAKADRIRNANKDVPKVCSGCKRQLPRHMFWRSSTNTDGLDCYCKTCAGAKSEQSKQKIVDSFDPLTFDWSGTKICATCREEKPKTEFTFRRISKDGLDYKCRSCKLDYLSLPDMRLSQMTSRAKSRAKKAGIDFDLDLEYVKTLLPQDMKCPILGIQMDWSSGSERNTSPSLDRIEPAKGYVKGNVAIISNKANAIKNDASIDDLMKIVNWLNEQLVDN